MVLSCVAGSALGPIHTALLCVCFCVHLSVSVCMCTCMCVCVSMYMCDSHGVEYCSQADLPAL